MDFLYTAPDIGAWMFAGLSIASFATAFIGCVTGTAGGLILLAVMANVMRPEALIAVHTVVQLGQGLSRTLVMWPYVMRHVLAPFTAGAAVGALIGAQVFIALPVWSLQLILGAFIMTITWIPSFGRIGGARYRFVGVGFAATFVGVFVSATGTLVAPFTAAEASDRRNHVATHGLLMAITHTLKILAFGVTGMAIGAYVPLMAMMILTGFAGNWVGSKVLNRVPEARFWLMFQLILTVLGLRLLWTAARNAGFF
jgi:uncharacterized membrane protein YfcA